MTSAIAAYTDFTKRKIYNSLTFTVILMGFFIQFFESGFHGVLQSFLGVFAALLCCGWLFVVGVMGAGDVKLLMAFGAVMGAKYCLNVALLSLFIGLILSLVWMIREKKFFETLKRVSTFFIALFHKEFVLYFPKPESTLKVPYGIALGIAAVWLLFENPLLTWGISPWN